MNEKNRLPDELNLTRLRFYETDFKALDYSLTEKEQAEWNAIYASYRSSSILSGEIIGVEGVPLPDGEDEDGTDGKKEMPCLTVVQYRVKVLIPEPFVWKEGDERETYVLGHMAGAKIDYIITGVDREGQCAVASRALAMERQRWHAHRVRGVQEGDIVDCMVLAVGASHLTLTTCGRAVLFLSWGYARKLLSWAKTESKGDGRGRGGVRGICTGGGAEPLYWRGVPASGGEHADCKNHKQVYRRHIWTSAGRLHGGMQVCAAVFRRPV